MDLLTGATGHLGNALLRMLLGSGRSVRVFLREGSDTSCLEGLKVERSYGDLRDAASVEKACIGINTVYHAASEISIMPSSYSALYKVNCQGTQNIIAACFKHKVKKLIYTSSIQALDERHGIIDETADFKPNLSCGGYNRTKAEASLDVLEAAKKGLHAVVLCPTAFIGPFDFKISLIGQFLIDYLSGRLKFIVDGSFDYVDVRDVAKAHLAASRSGRSGQAYILSGHQVDMRKMADMISDISGKKLPIYWLGNRFATIASYFTTFYYWLTGSKPRFTRYSLATIQAGCIFSSQKAAIELGYCPRPFEKSLMDTIQWYKKIAKP